MGSGNFQQHLIFFHGNRKPCYQLREGSLEKQKELPKEIRQCARMYERRKQISRRTRRKERKLCGNLHSALLHLGVFLKEIIKSLCQVVHWQDFPEENRFGTIGSSNGVINQCGSPQNVVNMLI